MFAFNPGFRFEAISKLAIRSEGPAVNKPGREAGLGSMGYMSAEGAAPDECVAPSALISVLCFSGGLHIR